MKSWMTWKKKYFSVHVCGKEERKPPMKPSHDTHSIYWNCSSRSWNVLNTRNGRIDIFINEKLKGTRNKTATFTSICLLLCGVFPGTLRDCPISPVLKNESCPLPGTSYQARLSTGYSYGFITLAVNQEPCIQLAPRSTYHWSNLSWQCEWMSFTNCCQP